MKKYIKFWWEYNKKKYKSNKIGDDPSMIWFFCVFIYFIGSVLYGLLEYLPESYRDYKKERNKFKNEWKKHKENPGGIV